MASTVILTDASGTATGEADATKAHDAPGMLHRAFSVYVFRDGKREILIQRRSAEKRLWPLIWANTCCSHPRPREEARASGERRLQEEMGFTCALTEGPTFVYRADDPAGKGVEHEHVTILIGELDEHLTPHHDPHEVAEWKWISLPELQSAMEEAPDTYAPWFHEGLRMILEGE